MKTSIKKNYIIEGVLSIFILLLLFLMCNYPHMVTCVSLFFWLILAIVVILNIGIPRNKNFINNISCRYIIISLLSYFLVTFFLGLFTGFLKSVFSLSITSVIKNVLPMVVLIVSKEIVRYLLCKNTFDNKQLIIITCLYTFYEIIMNGYGSNLGSASQIFIFIFLICLPAIAKQTLCTYISARVGWLPTLIYVCAFELSIYILPIFPDLGNYLNSLFGLLFPYVVYRQIAKFVKYNEKADLNFKKQFYLLFLTPVFIILVVIVFLVSGIFNYKMIAIGSDSMNPVYYRGDAVIYEKVSPEQVKEKDILVFRNNGSIITHRVENIVVDGNQISFQTRGDNNDDVDKALVNSRDVYGVVKYVVKYIGYPTILLQEKF